MIQVFLKFLSKQFIMIESVQLIGAEVCEWYNAPLFLFSGNVFSNLIYYSHLLPAIVAILFGVLVYLSDRKGLVNKILLFTMSAFALWSIFDLILWATERVDYIMFLWSSMIYIEPLIYMGSLYLVYVLLFRKDLSWQIKLLFAMAFLPVIFLAPTSYNLSAFDFTNCEREAIEGPLWYYIYALEFVVILQIVHMGIRAVKATISKSIKQENILITLGAILFLLPLTLGNIFGSLSFDWSLAQYGLFGMPIFIVFLSYLVVRYQRFNTKVFSAQILTSALAILILSLLLIQDLSLIRIIVCFTFIISIVFGYLLNVSIGKEIKQRKEIETLAADLETSNEKLKDLDKLKTEFLSLASHQLRSPLTAIKGYASMLNEGTFGALEEKQREAAQRIYSSAQGLVSIVEDLLNVSKIEQGGMKYEMMPTDLGPIVESLFNEMKIPAMNKGLSFTLDMPKDSYMVNVDPLKMRQIFLNLTDNAIKYTPTGFVKLGMVRKGIKIMFSVTDSGVGVTPETKAKLFEKFTRGEGGKLNTSGSGLGLYLALEIAKAHKGQIVIDSEGQDKGSTFIVELPAI